MASVSLLVMFFLSPLVLLGSAEEQKHHPACPPFSCGNLTACPPFSCGNLREIRYPFRNNSSSECGLYTIDCSGPVPKIQLKERGHWYEIDHISPSHDSITVRRGGATEQLDPSGCEFNDSFALPGPSMTSNLSTPYLLTIFNCSQSPLVTLPKEFDHTRCGKYDIYYAVSNISLLSIPQCLTFQLPGYIQNILDHQISSLPSFVLEVNVSVPCRTGQDKFDCLNEEGKGHKKLGLQWVLGTSSGIVVLILLFCCMWKFYFASHIWKKQSLTERNIEVFLKHYGPLQARRYSYLDVKKMTNSFKDKLGQGGFGSVYKGKLHDGCLVAVKVLDESKANGEEFINEVAAISRTSHVNIVSLLGFCFEGTKRALIYEFLVNGSLEKFVFDEDAAENGYQLNWETCYQISLGIARGLEYLHRGCNTRILHFDIKPHNILLDADFAPKISDFGLARICTRKESLISMLGPRGTIGYIAPEVFSRNFGGISHKSDVYSYGMMVLDMVGARKTVNIGAGNTSEIYFPHWIYKRLALDEELGLKRIISQEDGVNVRKMIIVSLWCIQTDPSNRPAMSGVIEMLEGSLDSLQVPPKPFLSSPSRSPPAEISSTF